LVEPDGKVTLCYEFSGLFSGVAFVVLIDVGTSATALLTTNEVEVRNTTSSKTSLEIGAPASLW
jgi:hypothetical protein